MASGEIKSSIEPTTLDQKIIAKAAALPQVDFRRGEQELLNEIDCLAATAALMGQTAADRAGEILARTGHF